MAVSICFFAACDGNKGNNSEDGYTPEESVECVQHECTKIRAKAATCEKDGNIEYWYCSVCDGVWSDEAKTNKITTEVDFAEFDDDAEVLQQVEVVEETVVDDEPFLIAETMPSFQGGDLNKFRNWVQSNVKFPQIALENGIQGRVVLSFVIEKDGRLTNIQVLQTPDRSLSEEAVRVLNKSPKWSPGKQRNQVVRVKYTLPVDFRVQN